MLKTILEAKKAQILDDWFDLAANTYPPDTAQFLKRQSDPFANPVGRTLHKSLEEFLDLLLEGFTAENAGPVLDSAIRVRAVQNFTAANAVAYIFDLKPIVRRRLKRELADQRLYDELLRFESKVDELGLIAFDIYMQCKERIYELKANEMRNRTYRAFKRAKLIVEEPEEGPDPKD